MKIGLPGLLFVLFLALKLTHYIDWPWLWVTAPLWGPLGLVLGFMVVAGIGAAIAVVIAAAVDAFGSRRRRMR